MTLSQKDLETLAAQADQFTDECLIPAGGFIRGCSPDDHRRLLDEFGYFTHPISWFDDEAPRQMIVLPDFYIDRYPVTNARFAKCVLETGFKTLAEREGWGNLFGATYWEDIEGACWYNPTGPGSSILDKPHHPVCQISRFDAQVYTSWLGKRLPTESEWEKACRGTDGRMWPWSNTWERARCGSVETHAQADFTTREEWHRWWRPLYSPHLNLLSPVGSFPGSVSSYGAQDMVGCINQWTDDWYMPYDPTANYQGDYAKFLRKRILRVIRGGSWMNMKFQVRTCERMASVPSQRTFVHGFRCARSP